MGDAILASSLLESLHVGFPEAQIDLVVRKGNHGLFDGHPFLNKLYVWDKSAGKTKDLFRIIGEVKKEGYEQVINCQRFFSTGLLTALSGGKEKIGYTKNPLAFLFGRRLPHEIGNGRHETERLHDLIAHLGLDRKAPKLYPSAANTAAVKDHANFITLAPASVWHTKQWPAHKWVALIKQIPQDKTVLLIGGPGDKGLCDSIAKEAGRGTVLAGQLSLLDSAALVARAEMNYVNDSAPLHMASAMDAPVTAVFCSTIPEYGFGPSHAKGRIVETREDLACRSCGLHGRKTCPEGHFKCAETISVAQVLSK